MSTSLYQKYRPQTFDEVVGQEHIRTTLLNEIQGDAVSHAYLFSGPRGVGKTTTARLLAWAVNCMGTGPDGSDADTQECQMIREGKAYDVIEIDAASHTGVDNVRENIIEHARVAPSQSEWKVFIIDEVHMLSTSAFNALLKTLEEPPTKTIFILATTELHKVPQTIVSRCERFQFRKIGYEDIVTRLVDLAQREGVQVDRQVCEAIAKRSEGALRDAESLLGQVLSLGGERITMETASLVLPRSDIQEMVGLWQEMVYGRVTDAFDRLHRLSEEGVLLTEFTRDFIDYLRKVLLYMVQERLELLEYLDVDADALQQIQKTAGDITPQRMTQIIEQVMTAAEQMKSAAIPQLPLELAVVTLSEGAVASGTRPADQPTDDGGGDAPPGDAGGAPQQEGSTEQPGAPEEGATAQTTNVAATDTVAETAASVTATPAVEGAASPAGPANPERAAEPQPESSTPDAKLAAEAVETLDAMKTEEGSSADNGPATPLSTEPAADGGDLRTIDDVRGAWSQILTALKEENHALHLTFKVGQLVSFEDDVLTMGYEYQFYQDRLNDARNVDSINKAFDSVFGRRVRLEALVGPEYGQHTEERVVDNVEQPSEEEVSNVWDLAQNSFQPPPA